MVRCAPALLLALVLVSGPAPARALALTPVAPAVAPDDGEEALDEVGDAADLADDPFCPAEDEVGADDEATDEADDPVDVADEDPEPFLDFCGEEDDAGDEAPARAWLPKVLKGAALGTSAFDIGVPGKVIREVRLAGTAPRAMRAYGDATLGRVREAVTGDGPVEVPVVLNRRGRKALGLAKGPTRLSVTSTLRLASGAERVRTELVLVRPRPR